MIHFCFAEPGWAVGARLDLHLRSDGGRVPKVAYLIFGAKMPRFCGKVKPLSIKRIQAIIYIELFSRYI
jgi:hypothetical protein